jgi:chemotaxis signal transduction protein
VIGVAAHKGDLLPMVSGDALFRGAGGTHRQREHSMVIRRAGFYFGITLSAIERDLKFSPDQRDQAHPVDPDFAPYTTGGFHHGGRFLPILDIDKLLAESEVADAAVRRDATTEGQSDE